MSALLLCSQCFSVLSFYLSPISFLFKMAEGTEITVGKKTPPLKHQSFWSLQCIIWRESNQISLSLAAKHKLFTAGKDIYCCLNWTLKSCNSCTMYQNVSISDFYLVKMVPVSIYLDVSKFYNGFGALWIQRVKDFITMPHDRVRECI